MNTQLTPPPEHDLRPSTRNRQRDELIAIVDHESASSAPRRRLVPLAAAAAVVAVVAGLAIGVPALRGDGTQPPVSGQETAAAPAIEPLSKAEQATYGKDCATSGSNTSKGDDKNYTVVDGFRWVKPTDPARSGVIVVRTPKVTSACVITSKGQVTTYNFALPGGAQGALVVGGAQGTYTKAVNRITVAVSGGPATEAVLRHGFFFAPVKWISLTKMPAPDSPPTYDVRGYDTDGKLVYATPKTFREQQAEIDACYTDPEGKRVVYSNIDVNKNPTVDECKRGIPWNW
jgi:hypothetical protein